MSSKGFELTDLDQEGGSLWNLQPQQWLQKSETFLLIGGILQFLKTIFIASILGWPSLECQVEKEIELQAVFTIGTTEALVLTETDWGVWGTKDCKVGNW